MHVKLCQSLALTISLFTACCSLVGCGGNDPLARPEGVNVSGKVLLPNKAPLTGGTLILRPVAGLYGATALIQSDGSFKLGDTAGNENMVPGKFQVFVAFPNPDHIKLASMVNKRYQESDDSDSDILVDIEGPMENLVIQLKR